MRGLGGLLVLLGAGSFVLKYLGREFSVLTWIDQWGPTTGNAIRGGCIVLGLILWFAGRKRGAAKE